MQYLPEIHELIDKSLDICQTTFLKCFGSYGLGLAGNDVDCLLITSQKVTRETVFSILVEAFQKNEQFSDVRAIANAYVPLIKFTYKEMHFDLLHCILPYETLDIFEKNEYFLFDDSILRSLDSKSFLSLNGFRTTQKILKLVPNVDNFLALLSFVKTWAKQRCLYSNIMGYWGGITWTIVVAKICQLYDHNEAKEAKENEYINDLFKKFLRVMAKWKWPMPITIAKIDNNRYSPDLEPWDPSHAEHELMPVLTPAYPSKNSSYNVMQSTASLMKKEFKRAYQLSLSEETFPEIFQESTFLTDYSHYIVITPTTMDKSDYNTWKGFVESKIKICIKLIESSVDGIQAIPFSKEVDGSFYIAIVKKEDEEYPQKEILNGCEAFLSHILSLPDTPYIKDKMDITVKTR